MLVDGAEDYALAFYVENLDCMSNNSKFDFMFDKLCMFTKPPFKKMTNRGKGKMTNRGQGKKVPRLLLLNIKSYSKPHYPTNDGSKVKTTEFN